LFLFFFVFLGGGFLGGFFGLSGVDYTFFCYVTGGVLIGLAFSWLMDWLAGWLAGMLYAYAYVTGYFNLTSPSTSSSATEAMHSLQSILTSENITHFPQLYSM
jgi:hypothetical protein